MTKPLKAVAATAALIMILSLGVLGGCAKTETQTTDPSAGTGTVTGYVYDPQLDPIAVSDEEYELTGGEKSITDVVEKAADTVVEITTSSVVSGPLMQQYVTEGAGSGVIITAGGVIVTNNHVIEGADEIIAKTRTGSEYTATLIATDELSDTAVIKIEADGLRAATFADSDQLKVGQPAIAIGNPLGSLGGTVTEGIISATGRKIYVEGTPMTLLQTTAAINPGNSGGGLFNLDGELIGIVNAKMSEEGIEGLGFAIPSNKALAAVTDLLEQGYVTGRPDYGFQVMEITDRLTALEYGVSYSGVYVMKLGANAPDSVKVLDYIVSIDGISVTDVSSFKSALYSSEIGDTAEMVIARKDSKTGIYAKTEISVPVIQYNPADYNI